MGGNRENPEEKDPEREGKGGPTGLCCGVMKEEEGLGPVSPDSEVLETLLRGAAGPRGPWEGLSPPGGLGGRGWEGWVSSDWDPSLWRSGGAKRDEEAVGERRSSAQGSGSFGSPTHMRP